MYEDKVQVRFLICYLLAHFEIYSKLSAPSLSIALQGKSLQLADYKENGSPSAKLISLTQRQTYLAIKKLELHPE